MTALAEIEAEEVQQALIDRVRRLRHELAGIDGLVRAHPHANKDWVRLAADISESANGLEALLVVEALCRYSPRVAPPKTYARE
jgi:hypothetical protein